MADTGQAEASGQEEEMNVLPILRDALLPNRGWWRREKAPDHRLVVWTLRILLVLAAIVIGSLFHFQTHPALH